MQVLISNTNYCFAVVSTNQEQVTRFPAHGNNCIFFSFTVLFYLDIFCERPDVTLLLRGLTILLKKTALCLYFVCLFVHLPSSLNLIGLSLIVTFQGTRVINPMQS